MGKTGRGLLMIATDVPSAHEAEVNDWYDNEHLEERVAIAGFLCARRYRALSAERKYLALYETENLGVLESPAYKQKVGNQTERSKQALGTFIDMHRAIARFAASRGSVVGGSIGMALLAQPLPAKAATDLVAKLTAVPGLVAAHLLEGDARLSRPLPEAAPVAHPLAQPGDWYLLVEGISPKAVHDAESVWAAPKIEGIEARRLGSWTLISSLSKGDL